MQASGGGPPPGGRTPLQARASTLLNLLGGGQHGGQGTQQSFDAQVLLSPENEKLAEMVEANSEPDQVVYTPDASLGNLITGLTGRPSTAGMFREVQSSRDGESVESSYLVVVPTGMASVMNSGAATGYRTTGATGGTTGSPGGPMLSSRRSEQRLQPLQGLDLSSLEYVGAAGGYSLYRNRAVTATGGVSGTVIPWWVVFPLLALALAAIALDWLHPMHPLAGRAGHGGR